MSMLSKTPDVFDAVPAQPGRPDAGTTYGRTLAGRTLGPVTTEIRDASPFSFAEAYHQQYLARKHGGYCGLDGTDVACPRPDLSAD